MPGSCEISGDPVLSCPYLQSYEKYNTSLSEVRKWIINSIALLMDQSVKYPVLYHCGSGKDRTGIIIAALLLILDVPRPIIIEEYLLSEGKVNEAWISQALDSIKTDWDKYYQNLNFKLIRQKINHTMN